MNAVPPPSRPSVTSVSGANHRRQVSLDLLDGYQSTSPVHPKEVPRSTVANAVVANEISNGNIAHSPKKIHSVDVPVSSPFYACLHIHIFNAIQSIIFIQ